MADSITVKSPAKINLTLEIGKKRIDGYHNVRMIMQSISIYDEITITKREHEAIELTCNNSNVPNNQDNLVYKASESFFEYTGIVNPGIHVHIEKNIPVQAGLAGGSTDCAAAFIALNKLFETYVPINELSKLGAKLGADVPFCFYGGTMLATGIGTDLKRIKSMPNCIILLIKPDICVSTKEAYKKSDERKNISEYGSTDEQIKALESGDIYAVCTCLSNDFQNLLQLEEVAIIRAELLKNGAIGACMSGSGPSVYGIFNDDFKVQECYNIMKKKYKDIFICKPVSL